MLVDQIVHASWNVINFLNYWLIECDLFLVIL